MNNQNQTPKEADTPEKQERNRKVMRIASIILIIAVVAALIVSGASRKKTDMTVETGLPDGCKPGYLFSETTGKPCPKDEVAGIYLRRHCPHVWW
jgi:hypothetical protein